VRGFFSLGISEPAMAQVDNQAVIRSKLRRAGFHPLPLSGKRPPMDKWSEKLNVTYDEIRLWTQLYPWSENTGCLTQNMPTIDIDIMIPEAADAIETLARDMFEERGFFLVRFGQRPKRAIPLRTNDPFKKITTTLLGPNGKPSEQKVELLCDGQQVVVDGIHPDTKEPYGWFGGNLGDVAWNDLPYVHPEEAAEFIERCNALLMREFGEIFKPAPRHTNGVGPNGHTNGAGNYQHADWGALVSNMIGGSNVHDSARDLAASFAAYDIAADCAVRILQSLMLASTMARDDRWRERFEDLSRLVISAYEKFSKPGAKPVVLKFLDMSAWDDVRPPERAWAVPGRVPVRQATLLSGEGSIGKTILELQLCVAHVMGTDWIGSLPEKGPAIYFGAEDDADELHRRLQAIVDYQGIKFKELIDNGLYLLSFAGEDCVLGAPDRTGKLVPTQLYERLLEAVRDIKPKHIGIDTSADVFGGNEVDRAQVRQFVGMLRKLGMVCDGSVVLLSHPSLEGIRSGSGISGSTGWHNSVRARMYFRSAKDENDKELRELEFMKNNYGKTAETIKLEFHNGIFRPKGSLSPLQKSALEARVDDVFLDVFRKLLAQGRIGFSLHANTAEYAPKQIADHPDGKEFRVPDYAAAMNRLLAKNKLHVGRLGTGSKQRQRLVIGPRPSDLLDPAPENVVPFRPPPAPLDFPADFDPDGVDDSP
jgi:RecA-family ATPase